MDKSHLRLHDNDNAANFEMLVDCCGDMHALLQFVRLGSATEIHPICFVPFHIFFSTFSERYRSITL